VFVGIESPDEETLKAMQKKQNTRRVISESIEKLYAHGFFVNAGFIIGFDTERSGVARGVIGCIEDTSVPAAMVGLLYALPNTQLTRRLATEGRLHQDSDVQPAGVGDQCTAGINYTPYRPRADILRDYLEVIESVYAPKSYFARVRRVGRQLDSTHRRYKPNFKRWLLELRGFTRLAARLGLPAETRGEFWRTFLDTMLHNPRSIRYTGALVGLYVHFGPFARYVASQIREVIAREEANPSPVAPRPEARPVVAIPEPV